MDFRKLSTNLSASPQLRSQDLADAARAGFRSVICNRPDGEGEDQPAFEEIERAARENGLVARYLPAEPGKVTDDHAASFAALMRELPQPVLAFCRTGTRAATMWALSQADERPAAEILATAKSAGYDLDAVKDRIVARQSGQAD